MQLAEGLLYRKQAKTEEATRAFKLAAQNGVPDAHLLLGIIYKENGDYEAAERECREAEKLNPQSGQVLLELGKLLLNRGDLEEARIRLEKAAFFMPDAASVHYQLGLLYRRLGQTEKAQEHFRKSKQTEPGLRPTAARPNSLDSLETIMHNCFRRNREWVDLSAQALPDDARSLAAQKTLTRAVLDSAELLRRLPNRTCELPRA